MKMKGVHFTTLVFSALMFTGFGAIQASTAAADVSATNVVTNASRPKVGLVLSGGGARGLSHIGTLDWMEQHHVPVDYITGTSIGGLIGGLYAMGMSPKEMREFIRGIDWVKVFGTGVNYEELSFRRKEDRRQYQVDLEFGLKHGLSGPPGLSTGHQVGLLIDRVTLPYSTVSDFSALPVPFRCMGADIIAAKPVVMADGLLSTAMRATMSLPGIFPPVRRNDQWLIDGGVLNNIPTDVMRDVFHPDVIIAVNVGTPLGKEKVVNSLLGVLSQTVGVMTYGSDAERLKLANIIVEPALGDITVTDFNNIDATADLGYSAAEAVKEQLLKFRLDDAAWQELQAARAARRRTETPVPRGIEVTGVSEKAAKEVRYRLRNFVNAPLNIPNLERQLTYLAGEGRYQNVDYGFVETAGAEPILQIRITEKSYAPPTLNSSISMEGSDISEFNFGLGGRLTFYDLGVFNSEWRNDVNAGFGSHFASEYFVPIRTSRFFLAPYGFYVRDKESFFVGGLRAAEYEVNRYAGGGDFGYLTWRNEFRMGYELGRIDANLSSGVSPVASLAGKLEFLRARWTFDGFNSATIPTRGTRIQAATVFYLSAPGVDYEFTQTEVSVGHFHPLSGRDTLFLGGNIGTTYDKDAAPVQRFTVGGPFRLSAYDVNEFSGNHYILIQAGVMHQVFSLPPLIGGRIWLMAVYATGAAFDDFSGRDFRNQGTLALAMDTRLGPFVLAGSFGENGSSNIFFSFGRFF